MTQASTREMEGAPGPAKLLALTLLALPLTAATIPLAMFVPSFYGAQIGLGLVGLIFMAGRFWDALSDPIVGLLSDRTRSRFGRRKPWIAAGAPVFATGTALLMFAPGHPGAVHLFVALFIFYLGWTMMQIPFLALIGELSSQYHQRTRIATYYQTVSSVGLLLILVLPSLLDLYGLGGMRQKLQAAGGYLLLTLAIATPVALRAFPGRAAEIPAGSRPTLKAALAAVGGDSLILRVMASDFAVTTAQTIRTILLVFFVGQYMQLPAWASALFLLQFVFGVFSGPIWLRIGYRLGKHRTAVAAELAQAAINGALLLVMPGNWALLLALTVAQGLCQGSGNLMLRAMVADIADRQRLHSGQERTALLFSAFSFSTKAATAVAAGIALPALAWIGFHPAAANDEATLTSLKLLFAGGPAIAHLISAALVLRFPLDAAQHQAIRQALDWRDTAAAKALPAE